MYPVPLTHFLPKEGDPGYFGTQRTHDVHTGIDLYTFDQAPVLALEGGVVVGVEDFTGSKASSPWWNDTQSVLVENKEGVILYGELVVSPRLEVGSLVKRGDVLGHITPVLKKDKGKNPTTMLHLEYYDKGVRQSVWWPDKAQKPQGLRNPAVLLQDVFVSNEYCLIRNDYQDKKAHRSQVPLINHIHEGIDILQEFGACLDTQKAFCLHPLLQDDHALGANGKRLAKQVDPFVLLLAMEYRKTANAYLSLREIRSLDDIELSPLLEVNLMLVADKIQNFKDFVRHHQLTHPRTAELTQYFSNWVHKLNVADHAWIKDDVVPPQQDFSVSSSSLSKKSY